MSSKFITVMVVAAGVGAIAGIGTAREDIGGTPTMALPIMIPILTTTASVPRSASHSAVVGTSAVAGTSMAADATSVAGGTPIEEAVAAGKG